MPALDQQDPRNIARRKAEDESAYMRHTTPQTRAYDQRAAYNEAALRQRAEAAALRGNIMQERLGMERERMGIAELRLQQQQSLAEIAQGKAELAELSRTDKLLREQQVMNDARKFLKKVQGAKVENDDFDDVITGAMIEFPAAIESGMVKEKLQYVRDARKAFKERQSELSKEAAAREKEKRATAVTEYGPDGAVVGVKVTAPTNADDAMKLVEGKRQQAERNALLRKHTELEKKLLANDRSVIAELNEVKSKLGFETLDTQGRAVRNNGASATAAAPAATAHPLEGQIVKQKSTGKTGRIINGQFVAQ